MTFNYCKQFPQNSQSTLIMSISRSTGIQHVYSVPWTPSLLILVVGLAFMLLQPDLSDIALQQNVLQVINILEILMIQLFSHWSTQSDWGQRYSVSNFSCFHELWNMGTQVTCDFGLPFCSIIYTSYRLLKMVPFYGLPSISVLNLTITWN